MKHSLKFSGFFSVHRIIGLLLIIVVLLIMTHNTAFCQCGDVNASLTVSISDYVMMVDHLFISHNAFPAPENSNCDGAGATTVRDAAYIFSYINFGNPLPPGTCPTNTSHYIPSFDSADTFIVIPTELPADDTLVTVDIYFNNSSTKIIYGTPLKFTIDGSIPKVVNVTGESDFDPKDPFAGADKI